MRLLVDSVIFIDHFNNIAQASEFISKYQFSIAISVITRAEVLTGFKSEPELDLARTLLDHFKTLDITIEDADLAASLRQKYRWKLPDAFQFALAQRHKATLVTRNTKDFSPHKHDSILIPY